MVKSADMSKINNWVHFARTGIVLLMMSAVFGASLLPPGDQTEQVRSFTRQIEFDFVGWTLSALRVKWLEAALGTSNYLTESSRKQIVVEYLNLVGNIQQGEWEVSKIYADPSIKDPLGASQTLRQAIAARKARRDQLSPLAEAILQSQLSYVAAELGLTVGGQPVPPVLYHATPLPLALIVSPRNVIRQDQDISLSPDIPVDQRAALEAGVDRALNVSSLVVPVGGIGTYPTMVEQSAALDWLSEVIAHEWVHNFLTLRPLGLSYMESPELRIMNETTASIAGKEIGRRLLERFYPELMPAPEEQKPPVLQPPAFDFRHEMHVTRVRVDELLAQGRIEEAESYMEMRRQVFWEQGYAIRKLNQAYFAFYGAYADEPGGAAGAAEDPVGAAVRMLRLKSPSLAAFLKRIAWVTSFQQLQELVSGTSSGGS